MFLFHSKHNRTYNRPGYVYVLIFNRETVVGRFLRSPLQLRYRGSYTNQPADRLF